MAAKTTFVLEANEAKAVAAFLKVVDAQDRTIAKNRQMSREGERASKSMSGVGGSVAGWLTGFASVGTVIQGLRSIVAEMEKATQLRKEMQEVALTTEQLSMKIAHLRTDVSVGGIAAVTKDVADIAKQTASALDVASRALFFSESAMGAGTARAKSAAMTITKFAGPAGLTPEETILIPKIFDITRAYTEKQQMVILNQLRAATAASIAETGEFIQPFVTPMTLAMQQGFTFSQALAQMVAAIQTTGSVEKAGTEAKTALEIAAGRTVQAMEFYQKEGRKRGVDYGGLKAPERYEFVRGLYQEFEGAGPRAMDVFKTKVGAKGFSFIRAMFGEAGQRKYFEVLPEIEAARESDAVQQMAEQYMTLLTAAARQRERRTQIGQARIAGERQPGIALTEEVQASLKTAKGSAKGWGDAIKFGLTPESLEKRYMAGVVLRENLLLALETAEKGTPERAALLQLYTQTWEPKPFSIRPDYLESVYKATEGFGLIEKRGRFAPETFREEIFEEMRLSEQPSVYGGLQRHMGAYRKRSPHYIQGLQYQYGLQQEEGQTIQAEQAEDTAKKLNNAAAKLDSAATKLERVSNFVVNPNQGVLD